MPVLSHTRITRQFMPFTLLEGVFRQVTYQRRGAKQEPLKQPESSRSILGEGEGNCRPGVWVGLAFGRLYIVTYSA